MAKQTIRKLKITFLDLIDSIYLKKTRRKYVPPFSLRGYVGNIDEFERVPAEFIAYFKLLCGLKMDQTVLDIGCGPGRFAAQLLHSPSCFQGEYYGFDINQKAINWANCNIASHHRNCYFQCVDLMNTLYRPNSKLKAETFSFPYSNDKFDFVFAVSVLTHLLPAASCNYLREIYRVLKPTGKALITFLLMDEPQESLSPVAREVCKDILEIVCEGAYRWHHFDNTYAVIYPPRPEAIVAYQEHAVVEMVSQSGLKFEKIYHGSWTGREHYLSFQDIVILLKP